MEAILPAQTFVDVDSDLAALARAVTAHLKGDPERALEALEASHAADTTELRAARAYLRLELKQYPEAAAEYDALLEARPSYAEGHYQRAVCLSQLGRFEDALTH